MKLTTQILHVYDPAMCCSTGICGPEVDTKLVQFAADLDWLKSQGVIVQRHNLSQNPAAFVENEAVKAALTEKGEAALPVILLNGKVATTGRYPDRAELAGWFKNEFGSNGQHQQILNNERAIMNIPNDNGTPGDIRNLLKPKAGDCDAGCGCHAPSQPGNKNWVIGVIVLAAAGVLVARAVIKTNDVAPKTTTSEFASLATLTGATATNASPAAATTEKSLEPLGSLSELNTLAAKSDVVFIYLPGKEETKATPPLKALQGAARAVEANAGQKCGLFTLKANSADYDKLAEKITFPSVLAAVKGRGMVPVAGDLTETKLVQGYVAASSAGGCGAGAGAGCCPK